GRSTGARARLFPADPASGASIRELLRMSRRNIGLALGEGAAQALHRWDPQSLERRVARVRTDNKLDRHEWLRCEGRLIKTDALDHHQGHDLIGCQDVAWDVAGAGIEFPLTGDEPERLVAATGLPIDRQLLGFYSIVYCSCR